MAKLLDKVKDFFGGEYIDDEEYDEYDDEYTGSDEDEYEYSARPERSSSNYNSSPRTSSQSQRNTYSSQSRRNTSQVVSIHTNVQMQVCIIKPECYDDAQEICDQVKVWKT